MLYELSQPGALKKIPAPAIPIPEIYPTDTLTHINKGGHDIHCSIALSSKKEETTTSSQKSWYVNYSLSLP